MPKKKKKDFARFQLSELNQNTGERLADYYARIREIAKKCEYGDHENDAIRDYRLSDKNNAQPQNTGESYPRKMGIGQNPN